MEKQMILTTDAGTRKRASEIIRKAVKKLDAPLIMLGKYYSYVLEHEVDMRQTKVLTEVQAAFFLFIMPADYSLLLRAAACAWFIVTLRRCRRLLM